VPVSINLLKMLNPWSLPFMSHRKSSHLASWVMAAH